MKFTVLVKIGRKIGVLGWDGEQLTVGVNAPPVDGAANKQLAEVLSQWLGISKSNVRITKGHNSRHKTIEIDVKTELFQSRVNNLPRFPLQGRLL